MADRRHPPPHVQLFDLASVAKRAGIPFDLFWEHAVQPPQPNKDGRLIRPGLVSMADPDPDPTKIAWPEDTFDRKVHYEATLDAKDAWRRAYEDREPTRAELALRALAPLLPGMVAEDRDDAPMVGAERARVLA